MRTSIWFAVLLLPVLLAAGEGLAADGPAASAEAAEHVAPEIDAAEFQRRVAAFLGGLRAVRRLAVEVWIQGAGVNRTLLAVCHGAADAAMWRRTLYQEIGS